MIGGNDVSIEEEEDGEGDQVIHLKCLLALYPLVMAGWNELDDGQVFTRGLSATISGKSIF